MNTLDFIAGTPAASDALTPFALDEIGYGVLVVDLSLRVLHANRVALRQFKRRQTLVEGEDRRLMAVLEHQQDALAQAVADAGEGRRGLVRLGQAPHDRMVVAMPLAGRPGQPEGVLLLCSRAQAFEPLTVTLFAKAAGLTASEQTVLAGLCGGMSVQDIAAQQSVQVSTIRTHIARIREKTGSRNIVDLVLRVARLPPMLNVMG